MRRYAIVALIALILAGMSVLFIPDVRSRARALIRPDPPPRIPPLALAPPRATPRLPRSTATLRPTLTPTRAAITPTRGPTETPTPLPPTSTPTPTPGPIEVNGRLYAAYIPAATKEHQAYKYS